MKFLQERGEKSKVAFTRTRAYRQNDNARVEGKNWTHARQLLGYDRLANPKCLKPLNKAYRAWCLMKNLFVPVMKLEEKTRIGGRYRKRYDAPRTPAQRLLDWPELKPEHRQWLEEQLATRNPFELSRQVEAKLRKAFALCRHEPDYEDEWGVAAAGEGQTNPIPGVTHYESTNPQTRTCPGVIILWRNTPEPTRLTHAARHTLPLPLLRAQNSDFGCPALPA